MTGIQSNYENELAVEQIHSNSQTGLTVTNRTNVNKIIERTVN